ncbi:MAG: AsmA family protein [Pseudomonadales bacterium]
MGIRIVKWVVYLLLILVVLLLSVFAFVVLAPDRAVGLLEYGTGYTLSADSLEIDASTSALNATGLLVLAPDGGELLRAEEFHSGVDPLGAWRGTAPFWDIQIRNAHLYLSSSADEATPAAQYAPELDFARILGARFVDVDSLTVHAGERETKYSLSLQRSDEHTMDLRLAMGEVLMLAGTLDYKLGARTTLALLVPDLDLRKLLGQKVEDADVDESVTLTADEAAIDWSWLGMLRKTDLSLQIGKLLLPEQTLNGVLAKLEFAKNGLVLDLQLNSLLLSEDSDVTLDDMNLRAELTALALATQGKDLKGSIALDSEGLELSSDGEFNVNGLNGNSLALLLKLAPQSNISAALPDAATPYLPLQLKSEINIDASTYKLAAIQASFGESDIAGTFSLAFDNGAATVNARLHSKALVLSKAQTQAQAPEVPEQPTNSAAAKNKIFSDEAISWRWLEQGDVDVKLTADILQLYDARFTDFALLAKGEQGSLLIEPLSAKFGGGGFSGSSNIEKVESGAAVKLNFEMNGVDLEAFGLVPQEQLAGGKTELELGLSTKGNSSAEMAGALQGVVHLLVHDAVVQNDSFELIGSDILLETLNKLNPFAKTDPTTKLHCALVHFDIEDGLMNTSKALVVETEKMEIIGDGSVNLDDETLNILITPNAKQTVGLNVGSVVKFMKLGGTLANPSPAVDAGGLLKSGASIGAAVSTGGVSLLAENLVKKVAQENACRKALATSGTSN